MNLSEYNKARYEQLPWVEKYKPHNINDMILEDVIKNKILGFIADKNIQNIILVGSNGVGKTCLVDCLCRHLYGQYVKNQCLILDATEDHTESTIQNDIVKFYKLKTFVKKTDVKKYSSFKTIVINSADNMTNKVQPQVNVLMEKYKDNLRFIFTCNSNVNIIEAIQSKCLILRMNNLSEQKIAEGLKRILNCENIKYDNFALHKISSFTDGDIRYAINTIQLISCKDHNISIDNVNEICGIPQQERLKAIIDNILEKKLKQALKIMIILKDKGYTSSDILFNMLNVLKSPKCMDISEDKKLALYNITCLSLYRISKGVDNLLQLTGCLTHMISEVN